MNDNQLPDDIDLPDDINNEQAIGSRKLKQKKDLDMLGLEIARKRDEAKDARAASGIEDLWMQCEEAYQGIDDQNRDQYNKGLWSKPTTMQGPVTRKYTDSDRVDVTSSAFIRLTSRYVDAGTAKIADILLAVDDKSFAITPMPIPSLTKLADSKALIINDDGTIKMRDIKDGEAVAPSPLLAPAGTPYALPPVSTAPVSTATSQNQPPSPSSPDGSGPNLAPPPNSMPPTSPQQTPMTLGDWANEQLDDMADSASRAETRIYEWLLDCNYPKEARMMLHDAARLGTGIIKGPVPGYKTEMVYKAEDDKGGKLTIKRSITPIAKRINPWDFFPDGSCGEDIHSGNGVFERDYMTIKQIQELKSQSGYLASQIDKVLAEGPKKIYSDGKKPDEVTGKEKYEIWYCYCTLTKDDMVATNAIGLDGLPKNQEQIYAIVTLVNSIVIKADINPLDSGKYPYHIMPWSRRAGSWAGCGIAEQIEMPQRMANAANRSMLNNAGRAAGSQIILNRGAVIPGDGNYVLTPDKIWYLNSESGIDDVRKAFAAVEFPNQQAMLMNIIEFAFKLAEEACNIPLITQGISSTQTPDTFGATNIQNENANILLRSIGYIHDDYINNPLITAFYEWLLLDEDIPNDEKQQFKVHAHGSSALVERAIQLQTIQQIGEMVLNPAFGINPRKWFAEFMRSKRLDPRKVQYTEEEQEKIQSNIAPPIPIAVAQLRAKSQTDAIQAKGQTDLQVEAARVQGDLQIAAQQSQHEQQLLQSGGVSPHEAAASAKITEAHVRAESDQSIAQLRAQTELAYAQNEAQMSRDNANAKMEELRMTERLALLKYANDNKISLDTVKAQLAKSQMDNQTKIQLQQTQLELDQVENDKNRQHDLNKLNKNNEISSNQLANEGE